jgi:hypothetical protein
LEITLKKKRREKDCVSIYVKLLMSYITPPCSKLSQHRLLTPRADEGAGKAKVPHFQRGKNAPVDRKSLQ